MAQNDSNQVLDQVLRHVDGNRRGFLKRLLAGSTALAALPLMTSQAVAQEGEETPGNGGKGGRGGKGGKGGKGRRGGKGGKGGRGRGRGRGNGGARGASDGTGL